MHSREERHIIFISQENFYCRSEENENYEISVISSLGDREEQQDCAGYVMNTQCCMAVVCDGMGGHAEGGRASYLAVEHFCKAGETAEAEHPRELLADLADEADRLVAGLSSDAEVSERSGTTLAAVLLQGSTLSWISAGDSRIYIWRNGAFARVTDDHTYAVLLQAALKNGAIDRKEYDREIVNGAALVSFLGINGLNYTDSNEKPFELRSGDRILIMTDGLYRLVSDEAIDRAAAGTSDIERLAAVLKGMADQQALKTGAQRDNMTLIIIEKQ